MKTIFTLLYYCLFIFLFSACNHPKESPEDKAYQQAISSNNLQKFTQILVIPRAGCGGCISDVTYFVVKNRANLTANLAIVFTGVGDKKLLKNEVGIKFINAANVFVDQKNYFLAPQIVSNYPTLITLSHNKEIISVSDFDAGNRKIASTILRAEFKK